MMTPIADMVAQMLAAGVAHEMIVLAVRTAESGIRVENRVDEAAEKRRAWDRQYRQARKAIPPESTRIPPEPENHCDVSKKDTTEESKKEKKDHSETSASTRIPPDKPKRGARLPADWTLSEDDRQFARDWGMAESEIDRRLAEFIDFWNAAPGQRGTKLNWSATWRNRIRAVGKPPPTAPVATTGPPRGWKPGMPTDAELRAKYASKPNGQGQAGVVSPSDQPRPAEPVAFCDRSAGESGGMAKLGSLLPGPFRLDADHDAAGEPAHEPNGKAHDAGPMARVV